MFLPNILFVLVPHHLPAVVSMCVVVGYVCLDLDMIWLGDMVSVMYPEIECSFMEVT